MASEITKRQLDQFIMSRNKQTHNIMNKYIFTALKQVSNHRNTYSPSNINNINSSTLMDDKILILSSWIMFVIPLARLTDKNFTVKFLLLFFQSFFHFGSFQPSVPVNTQVRRQHHPAFLPSSEVSQALWVTSSLPFFNLIIPFGWRRSATYCSYKWTDYFHVFLVDLLKILIEFPLY